jgi:hypothetical protein
MSQFDDPTSQSKRGASLWDNVASGAKVGAAGGALFGGVGAIPGAIFGGGLGLAKSVAQRFDEDGDREEFQDRIKKEDTKNEGWATSKDPDVAQAREEVFYQEREGRREKDDGMLGFFSNWAY